MLNKIIKVDPNANKLLSNVHQNVPDEEEDMSVSVNIN